MRVLIAPDCYTGTLSAAQAAQALAEGWARHAGADEFDLCPLADGGPGFLQSLTSAGAGPGAATARRVAVITSGPRGEPVSGEVVLITSPDGVLTGYLESAQACGLHLVPVPLRDPTVTTTAGVAPLMLAARAAGARRIVIGLGGSGTNDGGAGLIAGLAAASGLGAPEVRQRLCRGGAALLAVTAEELRWLPQLRQEWSGIEVLAAGDVDVPLLGFKGASAGFAAQKGATPEQAQHLERCLGDWAHSVAAALGAPVAGPAGVASAAGAGAAGGLGFALHTIGGRRTGGAATVLQAVDFTRRAGAADLVVTGEGSLDWQSLHGKVTHAVAQVGLEVATPVIAIPGQVKVGRRELAQAGFSAVYPVATSDEEVAAALADPVATLSARSTRVARTWSPRHRSS